MDFVINNIFDYATLIMKLIYEHDINAYTKVMKAGSELVQIDILFVIHWSRETSPNQNKDFILLRNSSKHFPNNTSTTNKNFQTLRTPIAG